MHAPADNKKLRPALRRAGGRVRFVRFARGILFAVAIALFVVLIAMGIDALATPKLAAIRWGVSLSLFGSVGWALWYYAIRPALKKIRSRDLARLLEARHPELDERLSTALFFSEEKGEDFLSSNAAEDAASLRPEREFGARYFRAPALAILAGATALALPWIAWPEECSHLLIRVLNPSSATGNVFAPRMAITPGTTEVLDGNPIAISMRFHHGAADDAMLHRIALDDSGQPIDGEAETIEPMEMIGRNIEAGYARFELGFPAATEPFAYWISSRRGLSDRHSISIIRPPQLTEIKAVVTSPDYIARPVDHPSNITEHGLQAFAGSEIEMIAEVSGDLIAARIHTADGTTLRGIIDTDPERSRAHLATWDFDAVTDLSGPATLELRGRDDLRSEIPIRLDILPDRPPVVRILLPQRQSVSALPGESVPIHFSAEDDIRVGATRLIVEGPDGQQTATDLPSTSERASDSMWSGQHDISTDLAGDAKFTVELRAWIEADDTRSRELGGVQTGKSSAIQIEVIPPDIMERMERLTQAKRAADLITQAREELEDAKPYAQSLEKRFETPALISTQVSSLTKRVEDDLESATSLLQQALIQLAGAGSGGTEERLDDVIDNDLRPAFDANGGIVPAPTHAARLSRAFDSRREIQEAIEKLGGMPPDPGLSPEEMEEFLKLMARRQEQIAEQLRNAQQNADDAQEPMDVPDDLIADQKTLAEQLEALRKMAESPP